MRVRVEAAPATNFKFRGAEQEAGMLGKVENLEEDEREHQALKVLCV